MPLGTYASISNSPALHQDLDNSRSWYNYLYGGASGANQGLGQGYGGQGQGPGGMDPSVLMMLAPMLAGMFGGQEQGPGIWDKTKAIAGAVYDDMFSPDALKTFITKGSVTDPETGKQRYTIGQEMFDPTLNAVTLFRPSTYTDTYDMLKDKNVSGWAKALGLGMQAGLGFDAWKAGQAAINAGKGFVSLARGTPAAANFTKALTNMAQVAGVNPAGVSQLTSGMKGPASVGNYFKQLPGMFRALATGKTTAGIANMLASGGNLLAKVPGIGLLGKGLKFAPGIGMIAQGAGDAYDLYKGERSYLSSNPWMQAGEGALSDGLLAFQTGGLAAPYLLARNLYLAGAGGLKARNALRDARTGIRNNAQASSTMLGDNSGIDKDEYIKQMGDLAVDNAGGWFSSANTNINDIYTNANASQKGIINNLIQKINDPMIDEKTKAKYRVALTQGFNRSADDILNTLSPTTIPATAAATATPVQQPQPTTSPVQAAVSAPPAPTLPRPTQITVQTAPAIPRTPKPKTPENTTPKTPTIP